MLSKIESYAASSYEDMLIVVSALIKFLEYFLPFSLIDTDPVVLEADQQNILPLLEGDVDARSTGIIVFLGIGQDIHQEHLKQVYDDGLIEFLPRGVLDMDVTSSEDMVVTCKKSLNQLNKVDVREFPFVNLALDPGKIQDTVDIV